MFHVLGFSFVRIISVNSRGGRSPGAGADIYWRRGWYYPHYPSNYRPTHDQHVINTWYIDDTSWASETFLQLSRKIRTETRIGAARGLDGHIDGFWDRRASRFMSTMTWCLSTPFFVYFQAKKKTTSIMMDWDKAQIKKPLFGHAFTPIT